MSTFKEFLDKMLDDPFEKRVTEAADPMYDSTAFKTVDKLLKSAGFDLIELRVKGVSNENYWVTWQANNSYNKVKGIPAISVYLKGGNMKPVSLKDIDFEYNFSSCSFEDAKALADFSRYLEKLADVMKKVKDYIKKADINDFNVVK